MFIPHRWRTWLAKKRFCRIPNQDRFRAEGLGFHPYKHGSLLSGLQLGALSKAVVFGLARTTRFRTLGFRVHEVFQDLLPPIRV